MNVGELYKLSENIDEYLYEPVKGGSILMILELRATYVATLINDEIFYWEYDDLEGMIEKLV